MFDQYGNFAANPVLFGDPDLLELGTALDFGPEELFNNREGYLSPAQINRLEKDVRWKYWPLIIIMTVLGFGYGVGGLIAMPDMLLILLPTMFLMMVSVVLALFLKHERENVPNRRVCSTVIEFGRLGLMLHRWGLIGNKDWYAYFIGSSGEKLFAPKGLYNTLPPNQIYRAYYAPGVSGDRARILSMEPIGEKVYSQKLKDKRKRIPFNE